MARPRRSHRPGAVFHLIARTQGQEAWFTEVLRSRITEYLASAIRSSDARLLAYAIMSNHLHLIVQQGEWRLGRMMQPFLSGIAGLVQRTFGTEGHVFERRYRDHPCLDPNYVRDAIVYTHLNPVRAGVVDNPDDYRWSSHAAYAIENAGPTCMNGVLAVREAVGLFAPWEGSASPELRQSYSRYLAWRMQLDRHRAEAAKFGENIRSQPPPPPVLGGDICWSRRFAPFFRSSGLGIEPDGHSPGRSRLELRDIAKQTLAEHGAGVALERVRSNEKTRTVVRLRRLMVPRMSAAGHRGSAIARYLRVSDQCVSNILIAGRRTRTASDG